MNTEKPKTEQEARADRALIHYHFVMAHLSVGDVHNAGEYLKYVMLRDGQTMHRSVCDMIAIRLGITPMEA